MIIKGKIFNGIRIRAFLFGNEDYEIYRTMTNDNILIVKFSLYQKWQQDGLLQNVDPFEKIKIEKLNTIS